ncbi:hypothetical protein [Flagellimonas sp. SN16]|uniref:hypothetical protein n=1 Tax=Flagellimonas sp. SN16 TaxID=3415142 RepID=UPI003C316319
MKKTILKITGVGHVPSSLDGIDIKFFYDVVTITKEGRKKPVEHKIPHVVHVIISGTLAADWGFAIWRPSEEYEDLAPLLMPYAIEHVKEKYDLGDLKESEVVKLIHGPSAPEFDMDEFPKVVGYEETLAENTISVDSGDQHTSHTLLADTIISTRDHINVLVRDRTGMQLLELEQEQNLKDLYRSPKTKEEFWYGMAALANLAGKINKECVLAMMGLPKKEIGPIKQLEVFLSTLVTNPDEIIIPLKSINHIRQGYPIHTDKVDNYIETLNSFGLEYPLTNYPISWTIILNEYAVALNKLFDVLKAHIKR